MPRGDLFELESEIHAGVAQLVEHQLPKLRVVSSNLIARFEKSPAQKGCVSR
jgi:hypothetical protein